MMFDLMSPCANCPFRKGQGELFGLDPGRIYKIATASAFQCHKTVDYSNSDDEDGFEHPAPGQHPQQCAGLMAVLHREDKLNQIMQVAERLGSLDCTMLDPRNEAYDCMADVYRAHAGNWRKHKRVKPNDGFVRRRKPKKRAKQRRLALSLPRRPRAVDPVPSGGLRR